MKKEVLTTTTGKKSFLPSIFIPVGVIVILGILSILLVTIPPDEAALIYLFSTLIAIGEVSAILVMIYLIIRTRRLNNASNREVTFTKNKEAIELKDIANHIYEIKIKDIVAFKGEKVLKITYHVYSAKTTVTIGLTTVGEADRLNKAIKDLQ